MRVVVIGGGGAGLVASWLLGEAADVTLYEASDRLGGHMRTIRVETERGPVFAEMGFKHFFEDTYPVLRTLHGLLGLTAHSVKGTISVVPRKGTTLVAPPRRLRHVVQWMQHLPSALAFLNYWCFLWRSGRPGPDAQGGPGLREAALAWGMRPGRVETFFLPLVAANWGSPLAEIADNPAWEIREVMWGARRPIRELPEGNGQYVRALHAAMPEVAVHCNSPVTRLAREGTAWRVFTPTQSTLADRVVIATEAPVAAALLAEVPEASAMAHAVATVRTFDTTTAIHRDPSWMPPRREDWSGVNVFFHPTHPYMTEWSGRRLDVDVFRSWIPPDRQAPRDAIEVHRFRHVIMRAHHLRLQREIAAWNGTAGLWLAGMYTTGADFHESAARSGISAAQAIAPHSPRLKRLREAVPAQAWPTTS